MCKLEEYLYKTLISSKVQLKSGIHVATDCNATSHRSQSQRVWGSVAASCSSFLQQCIVLQVVAA